MVTADTTEFPTSIGNVARRELAVHGITTFAHLTQLTQRDLIAIHGVGPKAVSILNDEMLSRGLAFKEN